MTHEEKKWQHSEKWDEPVNVLKNVQRVLHNFAEEIFRDLQGSEKGDTVIKGHGPNAELFEEDECVRVMVDLPGVDIADVDVSLEKDNLIVEGVRRPPVGQENVRRVHTEKGYGKFRKEIRIPVKINPDGIDASMKNGVLTITLPKQEKPPKIRINVKTE